MITNTLKSWPPRQIPCLAPCRSSLLIGRLLSQDGLSAAKGASHGFQAREGLFLLALLPVPNHQLLCCPGALGAVHVQYHPAHHFRDGGVHCLCFHPNPRPPGVGVFLQNVWLPQYTFELIVVAFCEFAVHMRTLLATPCFKAITVSSFTF